MEGIIIEQLCLGTVIYLSVDKCKDYKITVLVKTDTVLKKYVTFSALGISIIIFIYIGSCKSAGNIAGRRRRFKVS